MPGELEFFFDVVSPYTYLAATRMQGLAKATGATIHWRPFLLGGVFKATGNAPPAMVAARGRYMANDLSRWAARFEVPFRFPSSFPGNSLKAQRMLCALEDPNDVSKLALVFFVHHWSEGGDIGDPEALVRLANGAGFDGNALLAATADPAIKSVLIAQTEQAVSRGAFGAPTFFVGEEMFFGCDRLAFVEAALA